MKRAAPRHAVVRITRTETVCQVTRFSERVTWRAAELGVTLTTVAARLGVSRGRLSQLLTKSSVSDAMFERLTRALEWKREDWARDFSTPESRSREVVALLAARAKKQTAGKKTG